MVSNRKGSGKAASLPSGVALGAGAALGWTLASSAILAKLIDLEKLPENAVGYGALVILMSASFLGAECGYAGVKRQRLQVSLLTGLAYYLILLATTALFFGGQYAGMGVTALVVLAGTGLAILVGMRSKRGGQGRRYPKNRT